jgi:hypothetical protein
MLEASSRDGISDVPTWDAEVKGVVVWEHRWVAATSIALEPLGRDALPMPGR